MDDKNALKKFVKETKEVAYISNLIHEARKLFTKCSDDNKYYSSDEKRVEKLMFDAFNMAITASNMPLVHYDDYMSNAKLLRRVYNNVESAARIMIYFMSKNLSEEQVYKFLDENVNPTLDVINDSYKETCNTAKTLFNENYAFKYPTYLL